jgi:monofunctional biosynthetic peptidoglycan transglycosylase
VTGADEPSNRDEAANAGAAVAASEPGADAVSAALDGAGGVARSTVDVDALIAMAARRIAEGIGAPPSPRNHQPMDARDPGPATGAVGPATGSGEVTSDPATAGDGAESLPPVVAPESELAAEASPVSNTKPDTEASAGHAVDAAPAPASEAYFSSPSVDVGEPARVEPAVTPALEALTHSPGDAVIAAEPPAPVWSWRRVVRLAGLAVAAYFAAVCALILIYRFINPPATTLIAYQWLTGTKIEQTWVPIEDISPNLLRAVVVSEDWGFCNHYGVDLDAIERALEQAGEGKVPRGASTISMQVIKNLFLSQSKSYLRKAVEIPLTFVAEAVWPKSRMLEIYLNIAEWGPGIFGAEAAARHHFSKPASRLSEREAALLAAALPNPILRDAGDPGTRTARKASVIQSRMRAAGPVADCAMPRKADKRGSGWETTVKKRAGAVPGL